MKSLAFIPARGGSKRFPKKNIALLHKKPLINWTIEAALESEKFDKIVVSTDDPVIYKIVTSYTRDQVELHQRSEALSGDAITTSHVLSQYLLDLSKQGETYEQCCLLLPTCPFRSVDDIRAAYQLLTPEIDSVVSMKVSPSIPDLIFQANDRMFAEPFVADSAVLHGKTRSQDYSEMYYPNGAIYLAWTHKFLQRNSFYSHNFKILPMPEYRSVDIDIEEDLIYANALYERFLK